MKRKILALMLVIPLLFIFAVYGVTRAARIDVDVPVNGIKIINSTQNGVLAYDMAEDGDVYLGVRVLPALAKNKGYSFAVECQNGTPEGSISVNPDNGKLLIEGTGSAKITVISNDGGYTDSVTVIATSSKVLGFAPRITLADGSNVTVSNSGDVYSASLESDEDYYVFSADINPSSLAFADVVWTSSNPAVLDISADGYARAYAQGEVTVCAVIEDSAEGRIEKNIRVSVTAPRSGAGVTVNGGVSAQVTAPSDSLSAQFIVQAHADGEIDILGEGVERVVLHELSADIYRAEVFFVSDRAQNAKLYVGLVGVTDKVCVDVRFEEYGFDIVTLYDTFSDGQVLVVDGEYIPFFARGAIDKYNIGAQDTVFEWSVATDSGEMSVIDDGSSKCFISASAGAKATLVLEVKINGNIVARSERRVECVRNVGALLFAENSRTYGISNQLVYGGLSLADGVYESYLPSLELMVSATGGVGAYADDIVLSTSDGSIARCVENGQGAALEILGNGVVEIVAEWKYAQYFRRDVSSALTLKVIKDGVNVRDYDELMRATAHKKAVVLQGDIMLGKRNATLDELRSMVSTMPTDYDWRYYANRGLQRPEVMYAVEFFNDVYGNGFTINAEYIANAKDRTGMPLLYKGPLDFVSMGTASVKAQDNVSFLVRTDGVSLDNVVLKSCLDESLISNGAMNLSELNYVGTTLEINAANVQIIACRVSNGRTVTRIFGGGTTNGSPIVNDFSDVDVEAERASVVIDRCVLSNAREFILKTGSNRAVDALGNPNGGSPIESGFEAVAFTRANGTVYNQFENNLDDEYFVSNYLITDVTLRDSVLINSGIFAVGIEAHFAGEMLDGYHLLSPRYWHNLAATSFATALRVQGDTRIYDWKKLSDVDSSTLIETTIEADAYLTLDIPAMLDKLYTQGGDSFKDIFEQIDGEKYVHCGIAAYGGGYNYACVNFDDFEGEGLHDYKINMSILAKGETSITSPLYLQGTLLPAAAGKEDFRFFIYGADNQNSYSQQLSDLASGNAFSPIF